MQIDQETTPFVSHRIDIGNDCMVYYRQANEQSRKVIINLHGVTGTSYGMLTLGTIWAEHNYRVILPDLSGHGNSDQIPLNDFSDLATWLHTFIGVVAGNEYDSLTIVGHSMGSAICYEYALRYGLDVRSRLVLACPVPEVTWPNRISQRFISSIPESIMKPMYSNLVMEYARRAYLIRQRTSQHFKQLAKIAAYESSHLHHAYAAQITNLYMSSNPFKQIAPSSTSQKMAIIFGTKDNVSDVEAIQSFARKSNVQNVYSINDVGHILHIEGVEQLAAHVEEFTSLQMVTATISPNTV